MNRTQVKAVLRYFYDIPNQITLLEWEKTKCQNPRSPSRAPHSPDRVTVKLCVLKADADAIQTALDSLQGRYQKLLTLRYVNRYPWDVVAATLGVTVRTVFRWYVRILDRLTLVLEDTPMIQELILRAVGAQD